MAQRITEGVHIKKGGKEAKRIRLEAGKVQHLHRARLHRARAAHYAGDRAVRRETLLTRDQRIGKGLERLRDRLWVRRLAVRGRHSDRPWTDRPRRRERRG